MSNNVSNDFKSSVGDLPQPQSWSFAVDKLVSRIASGFFYSIKNFSYYGCAVGLSPLYLIAPERYYLILSYFTEPKQSPPADAPLHVEKIIVEEPEQQVHTDSVIILPEQTQLLESNEPERSLEVAPNGELSLHFAVREGQIEVARLLIKSGVDPMTKDSQGLSAVDHALLQNNSDMLFTLLEKKITEEYKEAINSQSSTATKEALSHISQINQESHSSECLDELQSGVMRGDVEAVKDLLEHPEEPICNFATQQNIGLLHLAAMGNSAEMIELLLEQGMQLTALDQWGRTPVHYAASNPNGAIFSCMVKRGADLFIKDYEGVSPISLLGTAAQERDPLTISKAHAITFAATLISNAVYLGMESGFIDKHSSFPLPLLITGLFTAALLSECAIHFHPSNWKKMLACMSVVALESIPIVGIPFRAWNTWHVAKTAFADMKIAYSHYPYRPWKALQSGFVYLANTSSAVTRLWTRLNTDYYVYDKLYLFGWFEFKKYYCEDAECLNAAYREYSKHAFNEPIRNVYTK